MGLAGQRWWQAQGELSRAVRLQIDPVWARGTAVAHLIAVIARSKSSLQQHESAATLLQCILLSLQSNFQVAAATCYIQPCRTGMHWKPDTVCSNRQQCEVCVGYQDTQCRDSLGIRRWHPTANNGRMGACILPGCAEQKARLHQDFPWGACELGLC